MEQKDNMFTFTFPSLTPDTGYEVIIQTRNREGWANPSNIFKFKTMAEGKLFVFFFSIIHNHNHIPAIQLFLSRQRGMFSGHSSQLQAGVGVINMLVMGVGVRWYS